MTGPSIWLSFLSKLLLGILWIGVLTLSNILCDLTSQITLGSNIIKYNVWFNRSNCIFLFVILFFLSKEHKNDNLKVTEFCLYKVTSRTLQVCVASWYIHFMFVHEIIFKVLSPFQFGCLTFLFGSFKRECLFPLILSANPFLAFLFTIYGSSETLIIVSFEWEQFDKIRPV